MNLEKFIAKIPNFPKQGIVFLDITPLLENKDAFKEATNILKDYAISKGANKIVSPEARGFMVGAPVSVVANMGFVPVRKPGKLPREQVSCAYDLEYGSNTLTMHKDAIKKGDKVVIIDDLLATGGTVKAAIKLVEELGGEVVGCAFLIELIDLPGKELLKDYDIYSLMQFKEEI